MIISKQHLSSSGKSFLELSKYFQFFLLKKTDGILLNKQKQVINFSSTTLLLLFLQNFLSVPVTKFCASNFQCVQKEQNHNICPPLLTLHVFVHNRVDN